jgi:hypothetical protein
MTIKKFLPLLTCYANNVQGAVSHSTLQVATKATGRS